MARLRTKSRDPILMRDSYFSGEDPVLILEFLSRFVYEYEKLEMNETQLFGFIPYFLKRQDTAQFQRQNILVALKYRSFQLSLSRAVNSTYICDSERRTCCHQAVTIVGTEVR